MGTHGQTVALAGLVDGVVDAVAEGVEAAGRHQDLGDAGMVSQAVDLGGSLLGIGGRDVNRGFHAIIFGDPLFQRPVIEGAAVGGGIVDGGMHGHIVGPAGEDGDVDAVGVEVFLAADVGKR